MTTILADIRAAGFSGMTTSRLHHLSVVQVTKPDTFDALNNPVPGGLYDALMGPTDTNQGGCTTCGLDSNRCPGHLGHIDLYVPVCQPLLFSQLAALLRATCLSCKRLRLSKEDSQVAATRLRLLRANLVMEAEELPREVKKLGVKAGKQPDSLVETPVNELFTLAFGSAVKPGAFADDEEGEEEGQGVDKEKNKRKKKENGQDVHHSTSNRTGKETVGARSDRIRALLALKNALATEYEERQALSRSQYNAGAQHPGSRRSCFPSKWESTSARLIRKEIVEDSLSMARGTHKCPHCGTQRVGITKAGNTRLFCTTTKDEEEDITMEDDQSPIADDEFKKGSLKRKTFLPVPEIEKILKQLWDSDDSDLLRCMWDCDGPSIFTIRAVAVPPNRFRPPAKLDGVTFEHSQTTLLAKILVLNDALKGHHQANMMDDDERLSRLWADWIRLQDAVNVLVDADMTESVTRGVKKPDGVRQITDKKQGLFRQNLMGKRVNYAARSVISPDPYISTDEVGIPLRFARTLTYPEPITPYNAKQLSEAVRRGPIEWPGAVHVEYSDGSLIKLAKLQPRQREDLAIRLLDVTRDAMLVEERRVATKRARAFKSDNANEADTYQRIRSEARAAAFQSRTTPTKVWRHLRDGDMMLANRQPTLHKASIMAHRARVIESEQAKTIRLHYANCYSYNADFDGDEINVHLPQNELARAEAEEIAATSKQYLAPTDGIPLRGLIQDHLAMGVLLTKPDTFLSRDDVLQFVFSALESKTGAGLAAVGPLRLPPPAVSIKRSLPGVKSQWDHLWTGKQVISLVLRRVVARHLALKWGSNTPLKDEDLLTLGPAKTKVPGLLWVGSPSVGIGSEGEHLSHATVLVRRGELIRGVLDKSQFGNSSQFGLVHSVYEVYGADCAADLLSTLGRLFTYCSTRWGHTCGIDDLVLTPIAERDRLAKIDDGERESLYKQAEFSGLGDEVTKWKTNTPLLEELRAQVREALFVKIARGQDPKRDEEELDGLMQAANSATTSSIIRACLPGGQYKPFPSNRFSLMVLTGAKGSLVNHSQVSCALGQQSLEGRRVPRTAMGKTLPCFEPYDPSPRAGGYVSNRFLSGVRLQEYYFHCMAGREGLLDTAVKTARSGYLQRCLIKHLEVLKVEYDRTVRQDDGAVVQFAYGDDGLDALNVPFLSGEDHAFKFIAENLKPLTDTLLGLGGRSLDEFDPTEAVAYQEQRLLEPLSIGSAVWGHRRLLESGQLAKEWEAGTISKIRTKGKENFVDVVFNVNECKELRLPMNSVRPRSLDPVTAVLAPDSHFGSVAERLYDKVSEYISRNPHSLFDVDDNEAVTKQAVSEKDFKSLCFVKYQRGLVAPGEPVGVLAAQGIGEPSTQMTLNTFHLAGHGAGNVTLGVPRLRELLMTASKKMKTPTMMLECVSPEAAKTVASSLMPVPLRDLIISGEGGIEVREVLVRWDGAKRSTGLTAKLETRRVLAEIGAHALQRSGASWHRRYLVRFNFFDIDLLRDEFNLEMEDLGKAVAADVVREMQASIRREFRRAKAGTKVQAGEQEGGRQRRSGGGRVGIEEEGEALIAGDGVEDERESNDDEDEGNDVDDDEEVSEEDEGKEEHDYGEQQGETGKKDEDEVPLEQKRLGSMTKRRSTIGHIDSEAADDNEEAQESSSTEDSSSSEDDDEGRVNDKRERKLNGKKKTPSSKSSKSNKQTRKAGKSTTKLNRGSVKSRSEDGHLVFSLGDNAASFFLGVEGQAKKGSAYVEVSIEFPVNKQRLLLAEIASVAASKVRVRETPKIASARVDAEKKEKVHVRGCNFLAAWTLDPELVKLNKIGSNDVGAILATYGVEAARASIVQQLMAVFGPYGIEIDARHLGLVADQMTFDGDFRPFSRHGMRFSTSPFLRASFETASKCVVDSALAGDLDPVETPSARLALGQLLGVGTGAIDVIMAV